LRQCNLYCTRTFDARGRGFVARTQGSDLGNEITGGEDHAAGRE
jgi:hypothetical protein